MKCRICNLKIEKGIPVPAPDGVNMTIDYICINCKNTLIKIQEENKYNSQYKCNEGLNRVKGMYKVIVFKCKCGCSSFHTFFTWKSKDIERMRCIDCNQMYERIGNEYKEWNKKFFEGYNQQNYFKIK